MSELTILVDRNEKRCGVLEVLEEFEDLVVRVQTLPKGDYWIGGDWAVERKTVPDLICSVREDRKRLFNQVRGMKDLGLRPMFIVEGGALYDPLSSIPEGAILDALAYLAVMEGVPVLRSEHVEDTGRLLYGLACYAQRWSGLTPPLRGELSFAPTTSRQRYIVEGLPGVGPRLAEQLLAHFGSVGAIFRAELDALQAVHGIGVARAQAIWETCQADYQPASDSDVHEEDESWATEEYEE